MALLSTSIFNYRCMNTNRRLLLRILIIQIALIRRTKAEHKSSRPEHNKPILYACLHPQLRNRQSRFSIDTCPYPHDDNRRQENTERRRQTHEYGHIISRLKITFTHLRSLIKRSVPVIPAWLAPDRNCSLSDTPYLDSVLRPPTTAP